MTKERALYLLRTWPRWSEPTEYWVRNTIRRIGLATHADDVRMSSRNVDTKDVPSHERASLALVRQLVRIAGGTCQPIIHTAYCGEGEVEKRACRIVIDPKSAHAEDDFFVRLDVESRDARREVTSAFMAGKAG